MSSEITIEKRVVELTVNDRAIEITKGWATIERWHQAPSYLSTGLPSATPDGQIIFISDEGTLAYSSGGEWIS